MGGGVYLYSVASQERLKETGLLILRIIKLLLKLFLMLQFRSHDSHVRPQLRLSW